MTSMLVSACGNKDKTSGSKGPTSTTTSPQSQPNPVSTDTGPEAAKNDQLRKEQEKKDQQTSPRDSDGNFNQTGPMRPGSEETDPNGDNLVLDFPNETSAKDSNQVGQTESKPALPSDSKSPIDSLERKKTPDFTKADHKILKVDYSDAGSKSLKSVLTRRMNLVKDAEAKKSNQRLAIAIAKVAHFADRKTKDAIVLLDMRVKTKEGGKSKIRTQSYELEGQFDKHGVAHLKSEQFTNGEATLVCLDTDNDTCYSAMIRIEAKNSTGNKAVARVISRKTSADLDVTLVARANTSQNSNEERMRQTLMNTVYKNTSQDYVRQVLIESFEVIGGRTGAKMTMITNQDQAIVGAGPLISPIDGGITTNVTLDRQISMRELKFYRRGQNFKTDLHQAIQTFRLVGNDGKDELTFAMSFDLRSQNDLYFSVKRIFNPIVESQQFNQLELNSYGTLGF